MTGERRQDLFDRIANSQIKVTELLDMIDERDAWIKKIYPLLRFADKNPYLAGRDGFSDDEEYAFQSLLEIAKQ